MQVNNASPNQKNIHAILQHRRLWHVSGVCIRNLRTSQRQERDVAVGSQHTLSVISSRKVYFKIVTANNENSSTIVENVVYESEHLDFSTNPSWLGFLVPKNHQTVGTWINLELWVEDNSTGESVKILNWNWNLSRLHYIAERLYHGEISFAPNALILQISGSFYSLSKCFSTDAPHGNCPHFNLDEEKASCNLFSLQRMIFSKKSISLSKRRARDHTNTCEQLLQQREARSMKVKEIEDLRSRIQILKLLLSREMSMLKAEKADFSDARSLTKANEQKMAENRNSAMQRRDRYNEVTDQLTTNRLKTEALLGQLSFRRIEVLSELAYIFPILPYTPPSGSKTSKNQKHSPRAPNFMICGIHLPEAESLNQKDDAKNAVAMGYVSQMLYMISYFLLIPVRYPLMLQGSQSSILDNVLETIQEKERMFPLFVRTNKERFLFEYGVYLLNRNIGQLRYLLGIPTQDLRPTLHNLKTLLEHAISVQQGRSMHTIRVPTVSLPKPRRKESSSPKPARRASSSPKVVEKNIHISNDVTPKTLHPEANGVAKSLPGLQEKVHDKSQELNSLRGELFGNTKSSKPIAVSPHRSASPSASRKLMNPSPSKSSSVSSRSEIQDCRDVTESSNVNATFLTGLEDLERGPTPKTERDPQKPLDIVAARNELFKTTSGRPVITKKQTYTMRASRTGSGHSENYFSTREQVFKIDDSFGPPATNGISEAYNRDRTPNGITENGEETLAVSDEDSGSNIQESTPLLTQADEDLDLC